MSLLYVSPPYSLPLLTSLPQPPASSPCLTPLSHPPQGMRVLVDARDKLGIGWQCGENEKQGMLVMSWEGRGGAPGVDPGEFQLYVPALGALWADAGIQAAYSRRAEFQLVSLANETGRGGRDGESKVEVGENGHGGGQWQCNRGLFALFQFLFKDSYLFCCCWRNQPKVNSRTVH